MVLDKNIPFFSVIMASHNAARFIEDAIQSVLSQTIDSWELVIFDDASTDGSYEIALRFSLTDQRIKVFRLDTNRGAGYARNMAVEKATGKWLAILDADDIYFPDKLQRQQDFIKAYNGADLVLVGSGVDNIYSNSETKVTHSYPTSSLKLKSNLYRRAKFPPHSSLVYCASTFREIGGFNVRFLRSQDYDLWLRLSEKGEFASLDMPLVQYRIHVDGISLNSCVNGFTQNMYSAAANVNFQIVKMGLNSPSQNDESFAALMELVRDLYVGSRYEKANKLLQDIKSVIHGTRWLKLAWLITKNPLLSIFVVGERVHIFSFCDFVFREYISLYSKKTCGE